MPEPESVTERQKACARPLRWTPELVSKFWNYYSHDVKPYFTSQFGARIARVLRELLPPGAIVLDYACGAGALTGHLLNSGLSVAACDLSQDSLRVVQERFGGRSGFLGAWPIADLPNSGLNFDGVALVELVEHVDDAVLASIFSDVRRVLSPEGVAVVTCPNDEDLLTETVYCPCCEHYFHRWQHVRSWSAAGLERMFTDMGLKQISVTATDFSLDPAHGYLRYAVKRLLAMAGRRRQPHLIAVARMPRRGGPVGEITR